MRKPSLRVLLFAIALIASAAVLAQQTGQIVMQPDTKQPVKIVITNNCKSPQTFEIKETPALSWISFTSGNSAEVSPGAPGSFVVTIQTNGMKPGEYKGTLSVICASCAGSVPPCLQDKKDFPLDVVIPGPDNNSNGGGAGGAEGGAAGGGKPPLPPPSNPPANVPPAGPSRTGGTNAGTPQGTPSAGTPQGGTPPASTPAAGKPAGVNAPTGGSSNTPTTDLPKTPPATTPQATTPTTPPVTPPTTSTGTEQAQVITDNGGGAGSNATDQIPVSSPESPLTTAVQLGGILLAGAAAGLLAGSGKLATTTTTPVATTPTPSKPVADTPVVPAQTPSTPPQSPGSWDAAMQTPMQDVVPHSSSGGGTPVTDVVPKPPTTPAQQSPGSWDATMQTPMQDVVPHTSSGGGTPVTDVVPKPPTTPALQSPGSWDATMQTPMQDVVPHNSSGGGTPVTDGGLKQATTPAQQAPGYWDATMQAPIQDAVARASTGGAAISDNSSVPPSLPSSTIGTEYIDPENGNVRLIPNGWVKLQPGPNDPWPGPSPFSSFPVGHEPRIFVNPQTGEQKWVVVSEEDPPPAGWVPKNLGSPLAEEQGTQYFDPNTGEVRLIPNDWVKLQPGPNDPWPGPSPFSSFPAGHEPRIFVNPQTGEQKWVQSGENPPTGWVLKGLGGGMSLSGLDPPQQVASPSTGGENAKRPLQKEWIKDQQQGPALRSQTETAGGPQQASAKPSSAPATTGASQNSTPAIDAHKPGDLNEGGGHTFSRGTTHEQLVQANRPPTPGSIPAATGQSSGGADEYAERERQIRMGMVAMQHALEPWDGQYDPKGEGTWIRGVREDRAAAEERLRNAVAARWGGNEDTLVAKAKGAAYDQVHSDPIRHEQDLILRRVWQIEIYEAGYKKARLSGLSNLAAHAYAQIQLDKWRDASLEQFEQAFGTHFAQLGQAISGDPIGTLNKAIEQIGRLVDEAVANVERSRELAKTIERQRAAAQAAAEAEEAAKAVDGTVGAAPKGPLTPAKYHEVSQGIRKQIKDVNFLAQSNDNCVSCAVATDSSLAGKPMGAFPDFEGMNTGKAIRWIMDRFKTIPKMMGAGANAQGKISQAMLNAGEGSRGIIIVKWAKSAGGTSNHAFNVVVREGKVFFPDGQIGDFFSKWQYVDESVLFVTSKGG